MRRAILILMASVVLLITALVGSALADVHGVSQAGCGNSSNAGATQSRDAEGRPDAPIPGTASEGQTQGQGGEAEAQGEHC